MPRGVPNNAPKGQGGSVAEVGALQRQLRHLAALEDPTNASPTALVWREMALAADRAIAAAGRVYEHGPA